MSWEENVRKVVPYTPGEQPNKAHMIKLNTNECPYPPAPGVTEALAGLKPEDFRLYPDPNADSLVSVLAEYYGLEKEKVFVGVGSDDVLALAFQTFFNSDRSYFRRSHIPFMMCGQIFTKSHMRKSRWQRISTSARKTIWEQTAV